MENINDEFALSTSSQLPLLKNSFKKIKEYIPEVKALLISKSASRVVGVSWCKFSFALSLLDALLTIRVASHKSLSKLPALTLLKSPRRDHDTATDNSQSRVQRTG